MKGQTTQRFIVPAFLLTTFAEAAPAQAITFSTPNSLAADDEASTAQAIGFNSYGTIYSNLYITRDGWVSVDPVAPGTVAYTPEAFTGNTKKVITPFLANVDTKNTFSKQVSWGTNRWI